MLAVKGGVEVALCKPARFQQENNQKQVRVVGDTCTLGGK